VSESGIASGDAASAFDLKPGLFDFYSSQAELMLAQYENIKRLLGPTTHGTPSSDLCEHLLRAFLRKFLPSTLSVDKGYFYGRSILDGEDTHCPEIDILVHDSQSYAPLYRTGDFVIVQPESVVAMIQVKLALGTAEIEKGFKNIIPAKQQLLDVLWQKSKDEHPNAACPLVSPPRVFTGIVGFEGQSGRDLTFYKNHFLEWYMEHRRYERERVNWTAMYALPSFIGSLTEFFVYALPGPYWNEQYLALRSQFPTKRPDRDGKPISVNKNVCAQALLAIMRTVIGSDIKGLPPLAFPDISPIATFSVLSFEGGVELGSGLVRLRRNDGWIAEFRRDTSWNAAKDVCPEPLDARIHVVCDASGNVTLREPLHRNPAPEGILVRRETNNGSEYEMYGSRTIVAKGGIPPSRRTNQP
jgi:hypothetical protein